MANKDYTVLALTSPNDQNYGATIKSALVYADKVRWSPLMLPTVKSHGSVLDFFVRNWSEEHDGNLNLYVTRVYKPALKAHLSALSEIGGCEAVEMLTGPQSAKAAAPILHKLVDQGLEAATEEWNSAREAGASPLAKVAQELNDVYHLMWKEFARFAKAEHPFIDEVATSISAVSVDPRNPYSQKLTRRDEVDPMVGQLLDCLTRTAVPSVDDLHFQDVLRLREAVADDLGELRLEMAALTPALRGFVGNPVQLAKEAKFIIESKILPEAMNAKKAVNAKKWEIARKSTGETLAAGVPIVGGIYLVAPPVALLASAGVLFKVGWDVLTARPEDDLSAASHFLFRLGK